MKEEIKRWIDRAEADIRTANNSFKSGDYYASAFWCQQVAEKAFKALLIKRTKEFPKIHDLTRLAKLSNAPARIIEVCAKLNPSYTASRYPDSPESYTQKEAEQMIDYCQEVLKWIQENLN
ncbi:MAG TPA: HEPN domain-containing protein [Candidatus Nanoarchaeia archaeon]|nr:HEPN domain-containing protein [Candidatus Nanoarchaeia archaeon]